MQILQLTEATSSDRINMRRLSGLSRSLPHCLRHSPYRDASYGHQIRLIISDLYHSASNARTYASNELTRNHTAEVEDSLINPLDWFLSDPYIAINAARNNVGIGDEDNWRRLCPRLRLSLENANLTIGQLLEKHTTPAREEE